MEWFGAKLFSTVNTPVFVVIATLFTFHYLLLSHITIHRHKKKHQIFKCIEKIDIFLDYLYSLALSWTGFKGPVFELNGTFPNKPEKHEDYLTRTSPQPLICG